MDSSSSSCTIIIVVVVVVVVVVSLVSEVTIKIIIIIIINNNNICQYIKNVVLLFVISVVSFEVIKTPPVHLVQYNYYVKVI
jgi:hypothetical protein